MLNFYIVTSNVSRHIIPAQLWMMRKYGVDNSRITYMDMKDYPLKDWCKNVADCLKQIQDKYIVFGLDDYLPIAPFQEHLIPLGSGIMHNCDRLGIGWGCRLHEPMIDHDNYLEYTNQTPYSVSCQFSVWNREALIRTLKKVDGTPWQFEVVGKCKTYALKTPAFRWIEESALSKRQDGRINLLGMKKDDIIELCDLGFIEPDKIIYGWKGTDKFILEHAGEKYSEFYV